MKIIAVYPGRFQPFHKGHAQVYKWLKEKFGNAHIATSNKVEAPKSPFNFDEKKKMMELAGVSPSDIYEVRNPYIAPEVLRHYDGSKTVLVFAVSEKDMAEDPRFSFQPTKSGKPGYLQPYPKDGKGLEPFGDPDKPRGYVVTTPTFTFNVLGEPAKSATEVRKQFANADHETQKKLIKDLFGKYDAKVHKVMDEKIKGALNAAPKPVTIKQIKKKLKEETQDNESGKPVIDPNEPNTAVGKFIRKYTPVGDVEDVVHGVQQGDVKKALSGAAGLATQAVTGPAGVAARVGVSAARGAGIMEDADIGQLDHAKFGPMLDTFVQFASKKLGIQSLPQISLQKGEMQTSFGGYSPQNKSIVVVTKNRHPMDVYRTVAHELVHHKQNEDGNLGKDIAAEGSTGSPIENEANAEAGKIMRWFAKKNPDAFKSNQIVESVIEEGLQDPARQKAVFLAGGPGSGKDFIMQRTLHGHGMREVNSDTALEYLMDKEGLSKRMPPEERTARDVVRGRAKKVTKEKERNAIAGRQGLIINGTADDPEKIMKIKKHLEDNGYDTMMVYVNTSNNVSRERNIQRGKEGGREVPEDIRQDKWQAAQDAKEPLRAAFGDDKFIHVSNSEDYRTVHPDRKKEIDKEHGKIFKTVRKFATAPIQDTSWQEQEKKKRGITKFTTPRAQKQSNRPQQPQPEYVPNPSELEQAKRLGVQHIGGGQFGAKGAEPTHVSQGGRLTTISEDLRKWFSKTDPEGGWKRINSKGEAIGPCAREPGEPKPKCMSNEKRAMLSKKERAAAVRMKRKHDPNPERKGEPINVSNFGKGKIDEACWDGYKAEGMKKKGNRMVPNCVPVEEANAAAIAAATAIAKKKSGNYDSKGFRKTPYKNPDAPNVKSNDERRREMKKEEYLLEKNVPTNPELWSRAKSMARSKFDVYPSAYANGWASKWYKSKGGGWKTQTDEAFESYINEGKKKIKLKKKLNQEDNSLALGYEFGNNGIGDEFGVVRSPSGLGMGYSLPMGGVSSMAESVQKWMTDDRTKARFEKKYGGLADLKLMEAANNLNNSLSNDAKSGPKFFSNIRENWEALGGRDMGTVAKQGKDELDEVYAFKKTSSGKWEGVGFGSTSATHELHDGGKPTGITVSSTKGGSYNVRKDGKHVTSSSSFVLAKKAAVDYHQGKLDEGVAVSSPVGKAWDKMPVEPKNPMDLDPKMDRDPDMMQHYKDNPPSRKAKVDEARVVAPVKKTMKVKNTNTAKVAQTITPTNVEAPKNADNKVPDSVEPPKNISTSSSFIKKTLNVGSGDKAPSANYSPRTDKDNATPRADKPATTPNATPLPSATPAKSSVKPSSGKDDLSDPSHLIRKREGFLSQPKWDVNAYRAGYGSDTTTREDGTVEKIRPGMNISRDDAERDLKRRIPEFQKRGVIDHVGQDAWDKLHPHAQTALTSLAYNYGSISKGYHEGLRNAIKNNDYEGMAREIEGYKGHNKGINAGRRQHEADIVRNASRAGNDDNIDESAPAWQRKEGENPEGGLNKKGIASYRAEHPGSKLSLAVTEKPSKLKAGSKKAKRRLSFCRRMKGMKAKLTSAETARDPDSRINKSLRKWNCEE